MNNVLRYQNDQGLDIIGQWLISLGDAKARARISARIDRLAAGNFGDCEPLQGGVQELKIDHGPGYRVYFARVGKTDYLLLCGGDKSTQQKDIQKAIALLADFKRRMQ